MRRWLPAAAYDHPVTVFMAVLALLVIGTIAWGRISLQLMPSGFEVPNLNVWVSFPNATPVETDEKIVAPLSAQLATISTIKNIDSSARADGAYFRLTFHKNTDVDEAYNAVSDRLERARLEMPEEAEQGRIWKFDMDDAPIVYMGVTIPNDVKDPYYLLERIIKPRMERQPGIATVNVWGVPRRSIYVDYDRDKIISHSIRNLSGLQQQMARDNFQMSGGQISSMNQNRLVRSLARFEDIETLKTYPVQDQLVLEDIAEVSYRNARSASINRLNGQKAVVMVIKKESGANTVDVGKRVAEATAQMKADPRFAGVQFISFFDQSEMVTESVDNLIQTALIGGFFAVLVLFLFLREWKMTLLIALSIPFSVLIAIACLYFMGSSLNILSLMGLMLAVGMVVDNAIVVVETIYRRRAEGAENREAAVLGSAEVNMAIIMSTATTMVVFLPLILMSGEAEISFFAGVLGLPVVFAMLASLFVALVFAPLATRYIKTGYVKKDSRWMVWLAERYRRVLSWGLTRRFDASLSIVVVVALTMVIPIRGVDCSPVDENAMKQFSISINVHPQAGYAERDDLVIELEEILAKNKEKWGIKSYYASLESDSESGDIDVYLMNNGPMLRADVIDEVKDLLPNDKAGVQLDVGWSASGGGGNTVDFEIFGEDMRVLSELGEEAVRRIKGMPEILGARQDVVNEGAEELHVQLNRGALVQYGLSGQTVGGTIAYYLRGTELPPLQDDGQETSILTQFEIEDRGDMDALLESPIYSPSKMTLVPLRSMADVLFKKAPYRISRENGITSISISVDLEKEMKQSTGVAIIGAALQDMTFPRGYSWNADRVFKVESEGQAAQLNLILMSVVFVFLLMGILFESWLLPLSVITTVPMAVLGAFWILWMSDTSFDSMAGIGLVVLVGVVVNNGIVLIDLIQQLRDAGIERTEAIIQAGQKRLRPILMTALTTIFGLVPMAMGSGEFVGLSYAPLGRTVIGGLIAATLLTLVFVPFLYAWLDDVRKSFLHVFHFALGAK